MALFPPDEYEERLGRLRAVMKARDVAAVIADESEMLHYFTGFVISENLYRAVVIPASGEPVMIVRKLDEAPFLSAAWFENRRTFKDTEDPVAVVAGVLAEMGAAQGRVGLDMLSHSMPVGRFRHLEELAPGVTFVDFSDVLRPLRLRKSPREIEVMRKAGRIADDSMRRIIASAKPGTTSRQAAAVGSGAFVELGADGGRTGPITVGRGWNFLHGRISDEPLQPGDVLHVELVPKVNGYCAKFMRPAVMGEPTPAQIEVAEKLIALQDRQIAAMLPGARAGDVDAIIRKGVVEQGLRPDYVNNTGYTLGFYFEQAPRSSDFTRLFTEDADWLLESGMTFHMYTSAAGIAFSEAVHVTDNGPERLTKLPRRLFRCGEVIA